MTARLALETPAPISETRELYAALRPLKRHASRTATLQLLRSETVGFRLEGRLVAVAGFYPLPDAPDGSEADEVWFHCRPELAAHMREFVRLSRLTLERASHHGAIRLRAFVRPGHRPGERLAVLCGLKPVGAGWWEWHRG
jgi:hypothetical protein